MKSKTKYVLGKICSLKYSDIGHSEGDTIWYWQRNRILTAISKWTFKGFHYQIMGDVECDSVWRGRATKKIVTVIPPLEIYAGNNFRMPMKLLKAIKSKFTPKVILVDTKEGLRVLEKS